MTEYTQKNEGVRIMGENKLSVVEVLRSSWGMGVKPEAIGADLQYAHLRDADLTGANLQYADLQYAHLQYADLQYANLRGADLRGANLYGADLTGANLRGADLRGADLQYAHLRDADLIGAGLWGGFQYHGLPSGSVLMIPTVHGWRLNIGCWSGTREQLRELISQDDGWPSARGAEVERRRPGLLAMLALADAHAEYYADELQAVVEKWGDKNE